MIVIADEMENTVDHYPVEFVLEGSPVIKSVLPDGVNAYEEISGEPVTLAVIESDDISEIVMLKIAHVDIQDIIVRTENDGDVPHPADFAAGNHPQPSVIQSLTLEIEIGIFFVIGYHSAYFVQIYNY
jgi:hypothetical protein